MAVAAPDNLTSLPNVKSWLQINDTDEDALLSLLIPEISGLITEECNRTHFLLGNTNNPVTWYLSGKGDSWLVCPQWPITQFQYVCNTTQGSFTLTNFSDTTYIFVNQSVSGPGIPTGSYVSSINAGAGTVTITNFASTAPTATATGVTLTFGIAVFENDTGYWNAGGGLFQATATLNNILTNGQDYALDVDQPDGLTSRSGRLFRINNPWVAQYRREGGMLAALQEVGFGNVMVQCFVGFPSVPADLEMACLMAVAKARDASPYGTQPASESYEAYARSLATQPWLKFGFLSAEVGATMAKYRIPAVGSAV
jgi:hypothetical protein